LDHLRILLIHLLSFPNNITTTNRALPQHPSPVLFTIHFQLLLHNNKEAEIFWMLN
jgi:hypothetical protein